MSKRISDLFFTGVERFHDNSIYLPSRTIYFGATGVDGQFDNDEVNSRTVAQVIKNLHILEIKDIQAITLLLNSPGGFWEDGIAVYDIIKKMKSPVTIIGIGKLYSMGSIIFQAGSNRFLYSHTKMMIHDGTDGYKGDSKSFENWAKDSKRVRESMYGIYFEHMKKKKMDITLKDIEDMCSHDTILTAKEAIKFGLADRII